MIINAKPNGGFNQHQATSLAAFQAGIRGQKEEGGAKQWGWNQHAKNLFVCFCQTVWNHRFLNGQIGAPGPRGPPGVPGEQGSTETNTTSYKYSKDSDVLCLYISLYCYWWSLNTGSSNNHDWNGYVKPCRCLLSRSTCLCLWTGSVYLFHPQQ